MSKSFTLTKEMKIKLLQELTIQAVSKNAPAIATMMRKANHDYWEGHYARVTAESHLPKGKWPHLIQCGIMTATTSIIPTVESPAKDGRPARNELLAELSVITGSARWNVMKSEAFREVRKFFALYIPTTDTTQYRFQFVSDASVPRMNYMERIAGDDTIHQAKAAVDALKAVLKAAQDFHSQALAIINPLRTSAQLLDVWPEAAKLLPEPEPKIKQELAPIEEINRVRAMLNKGVPQPPVGV